MNETIEAKGQTVNAVIGPQHDVPQAVDQLLVNILSWPRRHMTFAEQRFRSWLAAQVNALLGDAKVQYLGAGVMYCTVPRPDNKDATTLFSCHIDTVDSDAACLPMVTADGQQTVRMKSLTYDSNFGMIALDKNSNGTCLGADDGAGVWLMLKMLAAKVPGGYMFHTGEEVGCIGSREVLAKHEHILKKYEVAVAFDRPRTNEVITHQGSLKCASDKAAKVLCERLNKHGFDFAPSSKGVLTDTKIYRGVIAECFNIGVGYENQHGLNEILDYSHLFALADALCHVDWSSIPVDRDPLEKDPVPEYQSWYSGGRYPRYYGQADLYGGFEERDAWSNPKKKGKKAKAQPTLERAVPQYEPSKSDFDELIDNTYDDILVTCETEPEIIAETVQNLMIEIAQLRAECAVLRKQCKR